MTKKIHLIIFLALFSSGLLSAQTLCSENPNFICTTIIGAGTTLPSSSSLLPNNTLTGNICITGDFIINTKEFTFSNAIVKVSPDVKIHFSEVFVLERHLTLHKSDFFSCEGLWKGILMGSLSRITTEGCHIEDAEIAIEVDNVSSTYLYVKSTIFNRNNIGISIVMDSPIFYTHIQEFTDNIFRCTAPLNGTVNQISFAGLRFFNIHHALPPFEKFQFNNHFYDSEFGIRLEGLSGLGAHKLHFENILQDGIFVENGTLKLTASTFTNCDRNGINILSGRNINVITKSNFLWTDTLSVPSPVFHRRGIVISGSSLGTLISIEGNNFQANLYTDVDRRVRMIEMFGANMSPGTNIYIMNDNGFIVHGNGSDGIRLFQDFPEQSGINIWDNTFNLNNLFTASVTNGTTGIVSNGDKFNLDIIANEFFASPGQTSEGGITLVGSEGTNNQITENTATIGQSILPPFGTLIRIWNFDNATVCSNVISKAGTGFSFVGINMGTDFVANTVYSGQLVRIANGFIGEQIHKGNQWFRSIANVTVQAQNEDLINLHLSDFIVHTPQSTSINLNDPGFSSFHPFSLVPDGGDNEWWILDTLGIPAGNCVNQLTDPGNEKKIISDGMLYSLGNDASFVWQAERKLYRYLKDNPGAVETYSSFSSFLSSVENTTIGKLYEVSELIKEAIYIDEVVLDGIKYEQTQLLDMESNLIEIDSIITTITDSSEIADMYTQRSELLEEMVILNESISNANENYQQQLILELETAAQKNSLIVPSNVLETNEYQYNNIYIKYLKKIPLDTVDLEVLHNIALQCPKQGGMTVYKARGLCSIFFNYDYDDAYEACYPEPESPTFLFEAATEKDNNEIEGDELKFDTIQIYPNPSTDNLIVTIPTALSAELTISDAFGKLLLETNLNNSHNSIRISHIPQGVLFVSVRLSNGELVIKKIIKN